MDILHGFDFYFDTIGTVDFMHIVSVIRWLLYAWNQLALGQIDTNL